MDRSAFATLLHDAILGAIQEFRQEKPQEAPYGFAIIEGQRGDYLGYAVATEEGLRRVAARYESSGWRYQPPWDWENFDNCEKLAIHFRWANPDDGWYYGDFPERFNVQQHLKSLVEADAFGENAENLEEFCTDVLASLQADGCWRSLQATCPVVVGVTSGEDPRDFIRTATRCNPYRLVRRLWEEQWEADDLLRHIYWPGKDTE
jgi:hypothetical protein